MAQSAGAWLCLLIAAAGARADTPWLLLPPGDPVAGAALLEAAAELALPIRPLSPAQMTATERRGRIGVLAGAAAYHETIDTPGDGVALLGGLVESGGTLVVFAAGPCFREALLGDGTARFSPTPLPIARLLGLHRAGVISALTDAPLRAVNGFAWPADAPAVLAGEREVAGFGPSPPGWRVTPWLTAAEQIVVARLEPNEGTGRVVWVWSGLLAEPTGVPLLRGLAAALTAPAPAEAGPSPPSPLERRLAEARRRLEAALEGAAGLRAERLLDLRREARALELELPTGGEAIAARVAKFELAVEQALARVDAEEHPVIELATSRGAVRIELLPEVAPQHVENLLKLVRAGFYDGLRFHRVEPGFVAQVGCPYSRESARDPRVGTGGPGWQVAAEFNDTPHERGTVGMARSADPDSAGSQFYICLDRAPFLDGRYTVFGRVTGEGMAVVDQLQIGDQIERATVIAPGAADE